MLANQSSESDGASPRSLQLPWHEEHAEGSMRAMQAALEACNSIVALELCHSDAWEYVRQSGNEARYVPCPLKRVFWNPSQCPEGVLYQLLRDSETTIPCVLEPCAYIGTVSWHVRKIRLMWFVLTYAVKQLN